MISSPDCINPAPLPRTCPAYLGPALNVTRIRSHVFIPSLRVLVKRCFTATPVLSGRHKALAYHHVCQIPRSTCRSTRYSEQDRVLEQCNPFPRLLTLHLLHPEAL